MASKATGPVGTVKERVLEKVTSLQDYEIKIPPEVAEFFRRQFEAAEDPEHLSLILASMKRPPKTSTIRVNLIESSTELLKRRLKEYFHDWANRQDCTTHGPLDILVEGHHIYPDVITVDILSNEPCLGDRSKPQSPDDTQRQDMFPSWPRRRDEGWPMTHRTVVCDVFCGEAVLRGSHIYVGGILAADPGIREGEVVAVYAYVGSAKLQRGQVIVALNGDSEGHIPIHVNDEMFHKAFIFLGMGRSACKRSDYFRSSQGLGVTMLWQRAGPIMPPLPKGMGFPQNLPSILVAHSMELHTGQTILDMCAAPGGKTCHIASLVKNAAIIIACDKSRQKVLNMKELFRKEGATCITPLLIDTTDCCHERVDNAHPSVEQILRAAPTATDGLLDIQKLPPISFDRVLLDAPCSALGLRPKLCVLTTVKSLVSAARYQKRFVKEAVALLKPGGILTYSTCTFNAIENEGIVRHILDEYPQMKLLPMDCPIGLPGLVGQGLDDRERSCVRRFDPAATESDTIGFFIAKFRKE